jgi:hypothetical protein
MVATVTVKTTTVAVTVAVAAPGQTIATYTGAANRVERRCGVQVQVRCRCRCRCGAGLFLPAPPAATVSATECQALELRVCFSRAQTFLCLYTPLH